MACSGRPFVLKMTVLLLLLLSPHMALSDTFRTHSAFSPASPSSYEWLDSFLDPSSHTNLNPSTLYDDALADLLKHIVNYESSIDDQLAEDMENLTEELRLLGVPSGSGQILDAQLPSRLHDRHHGVNGNSFHRVQLSSVDQHYPNIDSNAISPYHTALNHIFIPTNGYSLTNYNQLTGKDSGREVADPGYDIIAQITDNLLNHRNQEAMSSMNPIRSDASTQFLKTSTYEPSRGHKGLPMYSAEHVPDLNKPNMRPSHRHIVQDSLKQPLFSLENILTKNPKSPIHVTDNDRLKVAHESGGIPSKQGAVEKPAVQKFGPSFIRGLGKSHARNLGKTFEQGTRRSDTFGANSAHFQNKDTLATGPMRTQNTGAGANDRHDTRETGMPQREQAQGGKGPQPMSADFSMFGMGSFVQDDTDCDIIMTKPCGDDRECQCYGFYHCERGRCQLKTSAPRVSDKAVRHGKQWHQGPATSVGHRGGRG